MVPLRLCDSLSMVPVLPSESGRLGPIHVNVRGAFPLAARDDQALPPAGPDNLIVRALELLRGRSGCPLGAELDLVKRIPLAAGLGGGSSDAAAALSLANRAWGLGWTTERLAELGAEVGSDVPFFFAGGPALCRGRGERVERLPRFRPLHVVIVKPQAGLDTPSVYQAFDAQKRRPHGAVDRLAGLLAALGRGSWHDLGRWMGNRLQAAAAALSPWVERAQAAFDQLDFVGHQLAGSGTAYFGVCRQAQHAQRLATILRTRQLGLVTITRSC